MEFPAVARRYYETIDAGDYDALADLLAANFCHHRPDRTLDGREAFVSFMREDRPRTDTRHVVGSVFVDGGDDGSERVAVEGRLLDGDGEELFGFVDVFAFTTGGAVAALRTYTD